MCNSRGVPNTNSIGVNYQAASAITALQKTGIELKCIPSKLGRKGDPRMFKALQARLNSPSLSLLDALTIGGFKFHWEGEMSYDEDHVQLSQRKNQLSRRLRLYKQNMLKQGEGADGNTAKIRDSISAKTAKKTHARKTEDSKEQNVRSKTSIKRKRNNAIETKKKSHFLGGKDDADNANESTSANNGNSTCSGSGIMGDTSSLCSSNSTIAVAGPSKSSSNCANTRTSTTTDTIGIDPSSRTITQPLLHRVPIFNQTPDGIHVLSGSSEKLNLGRPPMVPHFGHVGHDASASSYAHPQPVIYSGNFQVQDCPQHMTAFQGPTPGLGTSSVISSNSDNNNAMNFDLKMNKATDLYRYESSDVMKRCMLAAGFSYQESEENDENYLSFVEKVVEHLMKHVHVQRMRMKSEGQGGQCQGLITSTNISTNMTTQNMNSLSQGLPFTQPQPQHAIGQSNDATFPPIIQGVMMLPVDAPRNSQSPDVTSSIAEQKATTATIPSPQPSFLSNYDLKHHNEACRVPSSSSIINKISTRTQQQKRENVNEKANSNTRHFHDDEIDSNNSINHGGPRVFDLKEVNIEGDDWKAILHDREPGLDNILGVLCE